MTAIIGRSVPLQDGATYSIGKAVDEGPWTVRQKLVLLLVGTAIMFDGFDNQAIGFAAPAIIREWGITKQTLSPILALGQFGMIVGAALGGLAGDRFGRRVALIGSVMLFGILTCLIAFANGLVALGTLRLLANIGLGAAFPNAATLVSEFTPARQRSLAVTASIVCVPLGGVVGGLIASAVLPAAGWRMLFVYAGGATLLVGVLLTVTLPESLGFILRTAGDGPRLRRSMARFGLFAPDGATIVDRGGQADAAPRASYAALLARPMRHDTIALWAAFGSCLFAVYLAFSWLPAMLGDAGFDLAASSRGLTAFNVGGVVAALSGAWIIGRQGSRRPMVAMAIGGMIGAVVLMVTPLDPKGSQGALIAILAIEGAFINGVQTTLYALAAHIYPNAIRATGIGGATGIGRIGAVASSLGGAVVLGSLGAFGFPLMLLVAMALTTAALLAIRAHSARTASDTMAA